MLLLLVLLSFSWFSYSGKFECPWSYAGFDVAFVAKAGGFGNSIPF